MNKSRWLYNDMKEKQKQWKNANANESKLYCMNNNIGRDNIVRSFTYIRIGKGIWLCNRIRTSRITETSPCAGECTGVGNIIARIARFGLESFGQHAVRASTVGRPLGIDGQLISWGIIGVRDRAITISKRGVNGTRGALVEKTHHGLHLQFVVERIQATLVVDGPTKTRKTGTAGRHCSIRAIWTARLSGRKGNGNRSGTRNLILAIGIRIRNQRQGTIRGSWSWCKCCFGILGSNKSSSRGRRRSRLQGLGKALVHSHEGDGSRISALHVRKLGQIVVLHGIIGPWCSIDEGKWCNEANS